MDVQVQIKMNPALYIKDPDQSELGRKIIMSSISMIHDIGFEGFTFRKLSVQINTTEASIYRYFENKHRLLTYIINWYWTWLEYQFVFYTNNISDPIKNIHTLIDLLIFELDDKFTSFHINKEKLYKIVVSESNKLYLTSHVKEDNQAHMFKPYKDLCNRVSSIFIKYNPDFKFPHSLASTLVETAHHQLYFAQYLPSLTDFGNAKNNEKLKAFLHAMVFSMLNDEK